MKFTTMLKPNIALLIFVMFQSAMPMVQPRNIHHFVTNGDLAIVKELIVNGAEIKEITTALKLAACNDKQGTMVKTLLDGGADIDYIDGVGKTALHWASFYGNFKAVKVLLEHGAHVNCPIKIEYGPDNDQTPLHIACENGHLNVVRVLLAYGADIYHVNKNGDTSLDIAKRRMSEENYSRIAKAIEGITLVRERLQNVSTRNNTQTNDVNALLPFVGKRDKKLVNIECADQKNEAIKSEIAVRQENQSFLNKILSYFTQISWSDFSG